MSKFVFFGLYFLVNHLNAINMKIFSNHGMIYRFEREFNKNSAKDKALIIRVPEKYERMQP